MIKRLYKYLKALSLREGIDSVEVISLENHALVSSNYGFLPDWKQAPDTTWVPWIQDIQRKPVLNKRRWYGTDPQHGKKAAQEIADQVHMSVSSVSSMFKEETGSTVYDYLTGMRTALIRLFRKHNR